MTGRFLVKATLSAAVLAAMFSCREPSGASEKDLFKFYVGHRTNDKSCAFVEIAKDGALAKSVVAAERRFGGLPAYWELRAQVKGEAKVTDQTSESGTLSGTFYPNPDLLKKALELNLSNTDVIANEGRFREKLVSEAWDKAHPSLDDGSVWPMENDYIYINALHAAATADPDNAWYPLLEATRRANLGEIDKALDLYTRASGCKFSRIPMLFPIRYLEAHADELKEGKGAFVGISYSDRYRIRFDAQPYEMPNYIRIKDAFKEAIVAARMGGDWKTTFTAMHNALCKAAQCENGGLISPLVFTVLDNILCQEGLRNAQTDGDDDLVFALSIVRAEMLSMPRDMKALNKEMSGYGSAYFEAYSASGGAGAFRGKSFGTASAKGTTQEMPKLSEEQSRLFVRLYSTHDRDMAENMFWPLFEDVYGLDFSNPKAWSDAWLAKNVPKDDYPPER